MLDIKFIRENPDLIKEAVRKKNVSLDVDALLDDDHLAIVDELGFDGLFEVAFCGKESRERAEAYCKENDPSEVETR